MGVPAVTIPAASSSSTTTEPLPTASLPAAGDFTVTAFGATDGVCTVEEIATGALKLKANGSLTDPSFARVALPAAVAGTGQTYRLKAQLLAGIRTGTTRTYILQLAINFGATNAVQWYGAGVEDLDGSDDLLTGRHGNTSWGLTGASQTGGSSQGVDHTYMIHRWRDGGATWTIRLFNVRDGGTIDILDEITTNVNGDAGLIGIRYKNPNSTDEECVIITEFGTVDMSTDYAELFPDGS